MSVTLKGKAEGE